MTDAEERLGELAEQVEEIANDPDADLSDSQRADLGVAWNRLHLVSEGDSTPLVDSGAEVDSVEQLRQPTDE